MRSSQENKFISDFHIARSRGDIIGRRAFDKFGFNSDIDTGSTPEDIWSAGDVYTGFDAVSAEPIVLVSSSTSDAGLVLMVTGLDASLELLTETVVCNGTTPSAATSASFLRCDRVMIVGKSGGNTNPSNLGDITVSQQTSGVVFAVIDNGRSQTHIACFTVPSNEELYLSQVTSWINDPQDNSAIIVFEIRLAGADWWIQRARQGLSKDGSQMVWNGLMLTDPIPAGTDCRFRVESVSANGADISSYVIGELVRLDYRAG